MGRKALFYIIYVVLVVLFFELSFRAFYALAFKRTQIIYRPFAVIDHYYPGFLDIYDRDINKDHESFDLLLLGGSVVNELWGEIPERLELELESMLNIDVNIHNASFPAHTTRDSWLKFEMLDEKSFDAVVVYHGINETRFNHCPNSVFKDDYSHVDFYEKVNSIVQSNWSRYTVLPLVYIQVKTNVLKRYADEHYMPFHQPVKEEHEEWLEFGHEIKTAKPFEYHLDQIVKNAIKKDSRIIIPEFAYYIPDDYSLDRFTAHQLDFDKHLNPVELWGIKTTVSKGINVHNEIVSKLSESHGLPELIMGDHIERSKTNFDDLCHFTDSGSYQFAKILAKTLIGSNEVE